MLKVTGGRELGSRQHIQGFKSLRVRVPRSKDFRRPGCVWGPWWEFLSGCAYPYPEAGIGNGSKGGEG